MTTNTWVLVCLAFGLAAGCSGPAATPKTPEGAAGPAIEDFGPVILSHHASIDELTGHARTMLRASYTLAGDDPPGFVTTEWAGADAARWPGAQTRVVVEITDQRIIVRVQCRHESDSCARTIPVGMNLLDVAQVVADGFPGGGADEILAKMREFKDEVCACADAACIEDVEKSMMTWALKNMDKMKNMKPTRAQDEAADRIEEAMDACKERIAPQPHVSDEPVTLTPLPPDGTGSPQCDAYLATFDEMAAKCADKMGPALDAMAQSRNAQVEAFAQWKQLDKASRKAAIDAAKVGCQSATDALRRAATSMGCPL
jgi:hypothetical protein